MSAITLVAGASRGVGEAVARYFVQKGRTAYSISRSKSPHGVWIKADLSTPEGIDAVAAAIGDKPVEALLYTGGVWEKNAFTEDYSFARSKADEIDYILAVNLSAPVKLVQRLLGNLQKAHNPRVLFIGSVTGLDHFASREVANSASKYGLRGAAQALRKEMQGNNIGFTVINPGNIATDEVLEDIASGAIPDQTPIAMQDLLSLIDCALNLSPASVASEINLFQMNSPQY